MHLKTPLMNSSNCKYLPIYIIRINLHDNKEKIKDFYKNNEIAILVNQDYEKEYWNYLYQSNNVTKTPKNIQFIQRWKKMEEVLQTSDILVIAKYLGEKKTKIAKIRKKTKFIQRGKENEYKIYKLEDVKEFENLEYPILNSIIPHQVTLSPVKQRKELIHWLFSEEKYEKPEISLKNISPNLVELICLEWLRSNLAPKDYKIQFQFLKTGGNYADVDVFGQTSNGKNIACQITNSNEKNLLLEKSKKLKDFVSDIKILFCDDKDFLFQGIETISINKVWNDLKNDKRYFEFLEFLVYN